MHDGDTSPGCSPRMRMPDRELYATHRRQRWRTSRVRREPDMRMRRRCAGRNRIARTCIVQYFLNTMRIYQQFLFTDAMSTYRKAGGYFLRCALCNLEPEGWEADTRARVSGRVAATLPMSNADSRSCTWDRSSGPAQSTSPRGTYRSCVGGDILDVRV